MNRGLLGLATATVKTGFRLPMAPSLLRFFMNTRKILGKREVLGVHGILNKNYNKLLIGNAFIKESYQNQSVVTGKLLATNNSIFNNSVKRSFMTSALIRNKLKHQGKELIQQSSQISKTAVTGSVLTRLYARIKHLLVRDTAKLTGFDTVSAFIFSWVVMGNLLWIILGTSSFALALLYAIHYYDKLINDEKQDNDTTDKSLLGWLASSILSHGLGVSIEFQKGKILPQFIDGKLRFSSVKIQSLNKIDDKPTLQAYVDHIDMTLSFNKWYEGQGLIYDLDIFGLNGKIYRPVKKSNPVATNQESVPTETFTTNYHIPEDHYIDNEDLPSKSTFLDSNYHFDHVRIHDSCCEIYNDLATSPLKIIVFSGDFPSVNGNRLILDFFNANNVSGAINDSMFTIHKRQNVDFSSDKVIRFKIDGINMGTVSANNPNSKFNWIIGGKAQVLADIKFPNEDQILESDYNRLSRVFLGIVNDLSKMTSKDQLAGSENTVDDKQLLKGALAAIYHTFTKPDEPEPTSPYIVVDFKVKFSDLKASLPQNLPNSASNIPFVSLHNLRSLIQLVNEEDFTNNPITVNTTVIEKLSDLYNIADISTTKIFDSIVGDIYEDLLKMVKQHETKIMTEKSNSWSHSIASQLLLLGLGVLV